MYLDRDEIDAIIDKMIELGISSPGMVDSFLADISPKYISLLPIGHTTARQKLKAYLTKMNKSHRLPDGSVPLLLFLEAAGQNVSGDNDIIFFDKKVEKVQARSLLNSNHSEEPADGPAATTRADNAVIWTTKSFEVTPEAKVGEKDDTLPIEFFKKTLRVSRSVFKVLVHRHFDGEAQMLSSVDPDFGLGTGWVIGDGLMITNHHVVCARGPYEDPVSSADFTSQGQNTYIIPDYHTLSDMDKMIKLGSGALLAHSEALDFAIYQLPDSLGDRAPLRLRNRNITKALSTKLSDRVNIIQHPLGKPLRVGFRNNFIVLGDDDRLAYLTDTEGGSSGSPVCDDQLKVAALHRATHSISGDNIRINGTLVRKENLGVPIQTILAHLKDKEPAIFSAITN